MLAIRPLLAEYLPVLFQNTSKAKGSNPIRLIWILICRSPLELCSRFGGRAVERSSARADKQGRTNSSNHLVTTSGLLHYVCQGLREIQY